MLLTEVMMISETGVIRNLGLPTEVLLKECRGHFDPGIASRVCRTRVFPQCDRITAGDNLDSFLALFRHDSSRQEFLAFYVEELKAKVTGQAKCGCVHHAEEGVPCEHDLALLDHPIV
jgi:hypothetical protein